MKISDIFVNHGENKFREIEEDVIRKVFNTNNKKVIALGSGSFEIKI